MQNNTKHVMGQYHTLIATHSAQCSYPLSYLDARWSSLEEWQHTVRLKVMEGLSLSPPDCPLNGTINSRLERDGIIEEHISYDQPFGTRTEGILLYPKQREGKLPAVIALHDHGGFKYFGKEKLVEWDGEPAILTEFKQQYYEGRSWASELARRGYVVFVPDAFMWGSRRLDPNKVPDEFTSDLLGEPGTRSYIESYNRFAAEHETLIAKSLYLAGATWTGVMAYEDRRAVDYLTSRQDLNLGLLGCAGLSGGGLRTIYLAALDARISCAVCVGFMSTNREAVENRVQYHTWMYHVPALSTLIDLPDILSLHGNHPVMVQYDMDDPLWTMKGQQDSHGKLLSIYDKMGAGGKYAGKFYPGLHKFDIQMQEDAFDWFDKWLK
jgi:dienelactone hydrolase